MKDIVIVDGARTPMAEYNGDFSDVSAIDLAVVASKAALERSNTAPADIDHVIVGNALQTSGDAIYGARHVGLKSGVPKEVPALTVNRLCGSGIQSIINGAEQGSLEDSLMVALLDSYSGLYMAQTSDNLARRYDISREAQDQYALCSQKRAAAAADKLQEEIVPVTAGKKTVTADDNMRPDTTIEGLAKLRPAFAKD